MGRKYKIPAGRGGLVQGEVVVHTKAVLWKIEGDMKQGKPKGFGHSLDVESFSFKIIEQGH